MLLKKFDDYVVAVSKDPDVTEVDYLQIMLDIEEHVFPAVAEELQKLHKRAMRNNKKKTEETTEIPACDRTEQTVAEAT